MADANPGLRPGLSSAVPTGLDFATVVLTHPLQPSSAQLSAARLKPRPSSRLWGTRDLLPGHRNSYEASAETSTRDLPVGELRRTTLPLAFPLGFDEPLLWLCVPGAIAA